MSFHVPNQYRVTKGPLASTPELGNNGAFIVTLKNKRNVYVIASCGFGWEHVSVSCSDRCPTWEEMCQIKGIFWDEEDCCVQYHPQKSAYINNHPYCLHLWRPIGIPLPVPPSIMVGVKSK